MAKKRANANRMLRRAAQQRGSRPDEAPEGEEAEAADVAPEADAAASEQRDQELREEKLRLIARARTNRVPLLEAAPLLGEVPELLEALAGRDVARARALLDSGASLEAGVDTETKLGPLTLLPVDVALATEDPETVALLLDAGASVDEHWAFCNWLHAYVAIYPVSAAIEYQVEVKSRFTPVGLQAWLRKYHPDYLAVTRLLLERGCDPEVFDPFEGTSAAHKARKFRMRDMTSLFEESSTRQN